MTVPVLTWQGCYDDSWDGHLVPEAFAHPAKMARGLLCRILDFMLERGWIQRGSLIVDPFGSVGTTAIEGSRRGLKVVCVELEPRFVDLARQSLELHRRAWERFGDPEPVVIQGDSRELARLVGEVTAVVGSPPYADSVGNHREADHGPH